MDRIPWNAATGFGAPAEVVLPARAGVAEAAVHVDLDDIVSRAIDKVHRELDRVGLAAIEAAGNQGLDKVVLCPPACRWSGQRAIWIGVLVVVEEHADARGVVLEADVTHAGAVATVRAHRDIRISL